MVSHKTYNLIANENFNSCFLLSSRLHALLTGHIENEISINWPLTKWKFTHAHAHIYIYIWH